MQQDAQTKEIRRIATPVGNGSHIIVPKEWEGYEIVLTRVAVSDPKKEILKILQPYLENIIGVYIYGSYARRENEKESDIDVIVITDKKISSIEIKKPFDMIFIEKSKIDSFKKINPVLFYSFLFEAEPVLNRNFLEQLRDTEIKKFKQYIKPYLEDSTRVLKINKKLLELNKSEKVVFIDTNMIYSLILRLRGVFIIDSLLKNEKFSNDSFFKVLRNKLVHDPRCYYNLYRAIRDSKKPKGKVEVIEAEKLINLLEEQLKEVGRVVYAK